MSLILPPSAEELMRPGSAGSRGGPEFLVQTPIGGD